MNFISEIQLVFISYLFYLWWTFKFFVVWKLNLLSWNVLLLEDIPFFMTISFRWMHSIFLKIVCFLKWLKFNYTYILNNGHRFLGETWNFLEYFKEVFKKLIFSVTRTTLYSVVALHFGCKNTFPYIPDEFKSRLRSCFLCFIRRFWNQVFTWVSLKPSAAANSTRSGVDKYLWKQLKKIKQK